MNRSKVDVLELKEFFGICGLLRVPKLVVKGDVETDGLRNCLSVLNLCDLSHISY